MSASKRKGIASLIVFLLIVILIGAGITLYTYNNRHIPVPDGYIGNTTGNLNNHALFCENDGYIYFSNMYDSKKLYRMKPDGTEAEIVCNVPCEYINVYGDRVYFYQCPSADDQIFGLGGLYGICSTNLTGTSGTTNHDKAIVNSLVLYGDNLYYQHYDSKEGLTLYKATTDDTGKEKISDKEIFVACPYDGVFLTYNTENGYYLSFYNPVNDSIGLFDEIRAYNIIHEGNYLYYMNIDDSYRIYRYDLSLRTQEKLTDYTVDLFNVYGDSIFFQKNSETEPALMRMGTDGSNPQVIAEGNYKDINCTSTYTYFYGLSDKDPILKVPTASGSTDVSYFDPQLKK